MPNCSISFKILPMMPDSQQSELFSVVDCVIDYVSSTGVKYIVGPSETTMEGEFNQLCDIIREAQMLAQRLSGCSVYCFAQICYNPAGVAEIDEKLEKYR